MFENITNEMVQQVSERISKSCIDITRNKYPEPDSVMALTVIAGVLTNTIAYQQLQIEELVKRIES